ncbi:MAG: alkyl hydroperoxide reductase [Microbacteriaceae bacterium]|jgi:thiol-disulfide isomerase/thioredoxin|nr:alkyl hydroperoxide reductase [Microbacteriaceae bacterium]
MNGGAVKRAIAIAAFAMLALTGCASSTALDSSATNSNYIDDSGQPVLVKPADRGAPLEFTGKTEDGSPLSLSTYRGKVVVVNFWYSSCAPCRAEAPILQGLSDQYQDDGVSFIGVNTIDQADTAIAFEKSHKVTYPSVMDVDSGSARIAFHGAISANTVPVTFVLDTKGRVAARIVGELQSSSILNTLITQTLAEQK